MEKVFTTWISKWLCLFVFLLPWPTIWMYRDPIIFGGKWEYGVLGYYATELFLWGGIVVGIFFLWQKFVKAKKFSWSWTQDRIFVLALIVGIGYVAASQLWAVDPALAWQQALRVCVGILFFLLSIVTNISKQKLGEWFVGGMLLQSILALYQFFTQSTFTFRWLGLVAHVAAEGGSSVVVHSTGRWLRSYGAFSHPNVLGGFLVVSLAILFYLLRQSKKKYPPALIHAAVILHTAALFTTFSRSAWISFAILIGLLITTKFLKVQQKRFLIGALVLPLIYSILFSPVVHARVFGGSIYEVRSVTERIDGMATAKDIIFSHLVLGVGGGNYTAAHIVRTPGHPGWFYQPVHVVPLLLLAELGVVGLILFFFILFCYQRVFRIPVYIWGAVLFCLGSLFAFDHYLYSSYQGILLLSLIAVFITSFSTYKKNT